MLGLKRDWLPAPVWTSARHGARSGVQWKGLGSGAEGKKNGFLARSVDSVKPMARQLDLIAFMVPNRTMGLLSKNPLLPLCKGLFMWTLCKQHNLLYLTEEETKVR